MLPLTKQRKFDIPLPKRTSYASKEPQICDRVQLAVSTPRRGMSMCTVIELAPRECRFISKGPLKWGTPIQCVFYDAVNEHLQTMEARTHWSFKVGMCWHTGAVLRRALDSSFQETIGEDRRDNLRYEVS